MSSITEQIKNRLGVVDVVGACVKLEKAGINLKGRCPFHNEKTPSFFVSPDRGTFKCFGCGEGGDIFTFVEKFEGVDFMGALKILADKAGVEITREDHQSKDGRSRLYEIMEISTSFFQRNLTEHKNVIDYLNQRGLNKETIEKFRLGFAKKEWRSLYDFLKTRGFKDKEMEEAGLVKRTDNAIYDRFRGRVIFPIFDPSGRTIAFSGRIFEDDGKSAKYLNSPETVLFNKSKVLYGYNNAKDKIREEKYTIIVEGQMDLLMSHQIGFVNTVATSGTALTLDHLMILKRFSDKVVMSFDGDGAGISAVGRAAKLALSLGMDVRSVIIEDNMDPADYILNFAPQWKSKIDNSEHIVDFYLDLLFKSAKTDRQISVEIQKKILPFVAIIPSKIEQSYFISKIATKAKIQEDALWEELKKINLDEPVKDNEIKYKNNTPAKPNVKKAIIKSIVGVLWWQEALKSDIIDVEKNIGRLKEIVGNEMMEKIDKLSLEEKNNLIFETEIFYQEKKDRINEILEELFVNLKTKYLEKELKEAQDNLRKAEQDQDADAVLKYSKICDYINKKK